MHQYSHCSRICKQNCENIKVHKIAADPKNRGRGLRFSIGGVVIPSAGQEDLIRYRRSPQEGSVPAVENSRQPYVQSGMETHRGPIIKIFPIFRLISGTAAGPWTAMNLLWHRKIKHDRRFKCPKSSAVPPYGTHPSDAYILPHEVFYRGTMYWKLLKSDCMMACRWRFEL